MGAGHLLRACRVPSGSDPITTNIYTFLSIHVLDCSSYDSSQLTLITQQNSIHKINTLVLNLDSLVFSGPRSCRVVVSAGQVRFASKVSRSFLVGAKTAVTKSYTSDNPQLSPTYFLICLESTPENKQQEKQQSTFIANNRRRKRFRPRRKIYFILQLRSLYRLSQFPSTSDPALALTNSADSLFGNVLRVQYLTYSYYQLPRSSVFISAFIPPSSTPDIPTMSSPKKDDHDRTESEPNTRPIQNPRSSENSEAGPEETLISPPGVPFCQPPPISNFACASPKRSETPIKTAKPSEIPTSEPHNNEVRSSTRNEDETEEPITNDRSAHQCLSSSGVSAPSRHDDLASPDVDVDSVPSEDPVSEDAGVILDPENEGDLELIRMRSSGTSNITMDLDLLRPDRSSPSMMLTPANEDRDLNASSPAILQSNHTNDDTFKDPPIKDNNILSKDTDQIPETPDKDTGKEETEEEIIARDHQRMLRQVEEGEELQRIIDEQQNKKKLNSSSDSYESHDPFSTADEGGRAGLDLDHESQWVPSFIDTDSNLSNSKKRRRRRKRQAKLRAEQDSLGKLLSGTQTKEDEEAISTFDLGNHRRDQAGLNEHDPNSSMIHGGNIVKKRRALVDYEEGFSGAATLNSTKYGTDFEEQSQLRDGSGQEELLQDEEVKADEPDAPNEDMETNMEDKKEEEKMDNNSSNNSNGAKRKRTRNKKNTQKQPKPEQGTQQGRETRSRAGHAKTSEQQDEPKIDNPKKSHSNEKDTEEIIPEENKGEKEKTVAIRPPSQVAITRPVMSTNSDIRKLVYRAVFKSKNKISNNFAFNSKIQRFKISTNSEDVPKMPEISPSTPLVEITIPEFIWEDENKTMADDNMVNVRSRGVVQFVILSRSAHFAKDTWDTPGIELVRDFASYATCHIADLKLEFGTTLRWTNPWGNVVVMGLDTFNLDLLQKFRTFFTTLRFQHHYFNTFPKDAMTNNLGLSVLLKSDLREFKEKFLAEALFARNQLFGVLNTLQAETFTASDTTRQGVNKNGWRNVLLEGDDVFMESLSKFTSSHWFNIGPSTVQIHGGERRAETEFEIEARNKRRRFNMPFGQSLTSTARESINKSFRTDRQEMAKNPIASASSLLPKQSGAALPAIKKRK